MDALILPEKIHKDVSTMSIPPLDGTNYGSWKKAMRILFMRLNVLPIIDSEEPPDANALWYKCDRWVFSEIYFNCGKKEQESLPDTMSAREAWETLADVYQSSSLSNVFNSIKHIPGQPVLEFINSVLAAATDLRFLGENIQDQKIKWQLLGNLLPEYAGLVTALTNLDTDESPMNMEELKGRILTEERMLIDRKVLPDHHTPHVTQMPPPTSVYSAVEKKTKRCPACGVPNHQEIECWHKHPDKAPPWWKSSRSSRNPNTPPRPPRTSRDTNQDNKRKKKFSARHRDSSSDGDSSSSSSENSEDYKRRKKHKGKDKDKRDSKKIKDKRKALMMLGTPGTPTPATRTAPYIDHSCPHPHGPSPTSASVDALPFASPAAPRSTTSASDVPVPVSAV